MTDLAPTPASEWPKKAAPLPVELPSGAVAVLRQPNVFVMGRIGEMPAKVRKIGEKHGPGEPLDGDDLLTMLDFLVCASFVDPKCSFTRRKDTLCIADVSDDDKAFIIEHLGLRP
jgi:hypothetical protein